MSIAVATHPMETESISNPQLWTGRILSGLAVLFLLFDAIGKLVQPDAVVKGTTELGWPASALVTLGVIQLVCLIAYVVPKTSLFGAILWTGYLGGAVATHLRLGHPLFSHTLFPTYIAALLWVGLWLRDRRFRTLLPIAK